MTVKRYSFDLITDTGHPIASAGDTGPFVNGKVVQIHHHAINADTGGDLQIGLYPDLRSGKNIADDTGTGFLIYSRTDCLGSDFLTAPTMQIADESGAQDTGAAYVYAAGEALRVKVIAGRTLTAADTGDPSGRPRHKIHVYVEE